MIRVYLLLIFLFFINPVKVSAGYDMSVPVEGSSIANDALQFEVLKDIYSITSKLNPICINHKVINTQVIHYPYDVVKKNKKYVKGYWKELWTVEYCTEKVQIPVTFKITKSGTAYNIEKNLILK